MFITKKWVKVKVYHGELQQCLKPLNPRAQASSEVGSMFTLARRAMLTLLFFEAEHCEDGQF